MGAEIKRHRTAIARPGLSRPVRLAQLLGLLTPERTFFDYGCGRGLDLKRLRESGYEVAGWDPAFAPGAPKVSADVVNLGYVVNVIEDENERVSALRAAWELAQHLLVVSARIEQEASRTGTEFGDGCLTSTNTFQKYYSQGELREWIDGALEVQSVVVAPGIFLVFRDEGERQEYLASRVRRRAAIQPRVSDLLYQEHSELLEPLMEFFGVHGRVPEPDEVARGAELEKVFGSLRQAFCVVRRATGREQWDSVKGARKVDLKIYLALEMFGGRARFGQLSPSLQKDIRGHFGTYKRACKESDELLFSVGDAELIDDECEASPIGKKTPNGLYVHTDYIDRLSPILRVFEGCARSYYGMVEGSTLVKFNRLRPKVSYLIYPTFDKEAHPRLEGAWVISLGSYKVRYYDHEESENPPILHRKETFVGEDYPLYERFARLTRQEEKHGLFEETSRIGRVEGWQEALDACGVRIGGHRLFKVSQGCQSPPSRSIE